MLIVLLLSLFSLLPLFGEDSSLSPDDYVAIYAAERSRGDMKRLYETSLKNEETKNLISKETIKKPSYQATMADYFFRGKEPKDTDLVLKPNERGTSRGADIGFNTYHFFDGVLSREESLKAANSLDGKTPHEISNGFEATTEEEMANFGPSPQKLARVARPLTKIAYGAYPFMHGITSTEYAKKRLGSPYFNETTNAQKVLSGSNLAALILDTAYGLTNKENEKLTAEEARLLSYLNRREGVPQEIIDYKKFMNRTALARMLITVLGQATAPALLAARKDKKPISYVGNTAGILDSILSIIQRYKTRKLIKTIKDVAPTIKRELEINPPTEYEQAADRQIPISFDFDDID